MFDAVKKRESLLARKEAVPHAAADFDELPGLSALLAGVPGNPSGTWTVPPHKLLVWLEGDWVKFCIMCTDDDPKCWGSFQGLSSGFAGVERALQQDQCDWREPKSVKVGLRHGSGNGKT
jgi:hypothetical protein